MLVDWQIKKKVNEGEFKISYFNPESVNPNSYDVCLSRHILIYEDKVIDPSKEPNYKRIVMPLNKKYLLKKGKFYLGSTLESITSPGYLQTLHGKSSVGRLGLFVHTVAGFGDIGFEGTWTLELVPMVDVYVIPYMRIAQISFEKVGIPKKEYQGSYKYQNLPKPYNPKSFGLDMEIKDCLNET